MEARGDELEQLERMVAELIGEAALVGAYAETIRLVPETAGGFGKLLTKHQGRVAALADEIKAGVGRVGIGAAPARIRVVR